MPPALCTCQRTYLPQGIVMGHSMRPEHTRACSLNGFYLLLGITHLFPHNELVYLQYTAVATNTRAD